MSLDSDTALADVPVSLTGSSAQYRGSQLKDITDSSKSYDVEIKMSDSRGGDAYRGVFGTYVRDLVRNIAEAESISQVRITPITQVGEVHN